MGMLLTHFQQVDTNLFLWIQSKVKDKKFLSLVRAISKTGDGWLYGIVAFSILIIDRQQNFNFFFSCLVSYSLAVPLYAFLKKQFKRNRPQYYLTNFQAKIIAPDDFSFPSGHTASAFVMAVQVLLFFPQYFIYVLIYAMAIGLSRVFLGVHFPGDVIAGAIIGCLCSFLSYLIIV